MNIEYKGSYRFTSSYDTFKRCVDVTKILLAKKQLILLFGCTKNVKFHLFINREQFNKEYPDISFEEFQSILFEEIAFIIEQNIVMPDFEEPSLPEYLKANGIEESDIQQIIQEKADKRKYVQEKILFEDALLRYKFKKSTMANKLSDIRYEINKYIFCDENELRYAVIEFSSVDKLSAEEVPFFINKEKNTEKSKFVCDKQDLDYIIFQLQQIKEKL